MNRCSHCSQELRTTDPAIFYCGDTCKRLYHQRLTASLPQRRRVEPRRQVTRPPGVAAVLADRAAAHAASVREAETALASRRSSEDTARLFAAQEAEMMTRLALRRDLKR